MLKPYLKWYLSHLIKKRIIFIFVLSGITFHMLIRLVVPFLFGVIVEDLSKGVLANIQYYALLLLLSGLIANFGDLIMSAGNEILAQSVEMSTRIEFFNSMTKKTMAFHDEAKVGTLMALVSNDIRMMNLTVSPGLRILLEPVVASSGVILLSFLIHPLIGLLLLLSMPVLLLSIKWFHNRSKPISILQQEQFRTVNADLQEKIVNNKVIKGFTQEEFEVETFSNKNKNLAQIKIQRSFLQGFYTPGLVLTIITGILFILSVDLYFKKELLIQDVIALSSMMIYLRGPILLINNALQMSMLGMAGAEQLHKLIHEENFGKEIEGTKNIQLQGKVEFKDITFEYIKNKPVLKGISFTVEPGETVAVLGPTGAGKTSLLKLLSRFYDPIQGQILVDGIPISQLELENLRSQIAVVEQDIFLFSTSVKDNIAYSKDKIDMDKLITSAKLAKAYDFIELLPEKFETIIGERGLTLSGGQRQRIGIARAFYADPKILILDDSTSALDVETEREVAIAIDNIQKNRTTFIISHRLATIRRADKILLLSTEGELQAVGTHETLLESSMLYRNIFRLGKNNTAGS